MKKFVKKIIKKINKKEVIPIQIIADDNFRFKGKVALVGGGSGGIGLAITKKLISNGCKVIITGTNEKKLKKIEEDINSDKLSTLVINYLQPDVFDEKIQEAARIFGKIDIFVSSTGIHVDRDDLDFLNTSISEYESIMDTNLKGTYFICQAVAKYMIANRIKGHILLISSQSALEPSWSPYRLSKLGIDGITRGMAQRLLDYGIIVNAIGPGPTATTMQKNFTGTDISTNLNPIKRYTMPEEVAEVALMMVSDIGNTIVGDTLYMSGGRGITEIR